MDIYVCMHVILLCDVLHKHVHRHNVNVNTVKLLIGMLVT